MRCKYCGVEINFYHDRTTKRKIPVALDGHVHRCLGNVKYSNSYWVGA